MFEGPEVDDCGLFERQKEEQWRGRGRAWIVQDLKAMGKSCEFSLTGRASLWRRGPPGGCGEDTLDRVGEASGGHQAEVAAGAQVGRRGAARTWVHFGGPRARLLWGCIQKGKT